jgi:hypothetical protein
MVDGKGKKRTEIEILKKHRMEFLNILIFI